MTQEHAWEREYAQPTFLTKDNKPQQDVIRFVHFLKKEWRENTIEFQKMHLLDLGSGTGRNSFYFAELGAHVTGLEISPTAVKLAKENTDKARLDITYIQQSIGEKFPVADNSCDIVLDVTSSNSLTEAEREVYLAETARVLKPSGYFFVKALCKDGDENAKHLLKEAPGPEKDMYIMPNTGIMERVWSRADFVATYETYFNIVHLEKKTSYTRMNGRVYKRNFWLGYLQKISKQ